MLFLVRPRLRAWPSSRSCSRYGAASGAAAGGLKGQLSTKRGQLQADQAQQTALSSTLEHYSSQIDQLSGQVAALRDREATVQGQLDAKEAQLRDAKARLARVRVHLHKSLKVLRQRLVATYESNRPDILNVILSSHGFNQLNSRYAYLQSIEHQDASIVASVRRLRNDVRDTVDRIHSARDRLAAKRAELARTETQLQARQSALTSARDQKQAALSEVQANSRQLQGEISDIQGRIAQAAAARRRGAQAAAAGCGAGSGSSNGDDFAISPRRTHARAGFVPARPGAARSGDLTVPGLLSDRLGENRSGNRRHHNARVAATRDGIRHGHDRTRPRRIRRLLSDHPHFLRRLLLRPLRAHGRRRSERLHRTADRDRPHRDLGKLDHTGRL